MKSTLRYASSKFALTWLFMFPFLMIWSQCPPPSVSSTTPTCGNSATLSASGSTGLYRWYNTSIGGSVLATGPTYTTGTLNNATQFFYVEAVDNLSSPNCLSGRVAVLVQTTPISSSAVALGATVSCGASATVTVSGGPSSFYRWYSEASGGVELGVGNSISVTPSATDTVWVTSLAGNPAGSQNYSSPGTYNWTVPAGVFSVQVDMAGAKGGDQCNGTVGGRGGRVQATIPVTPGQTLQINVGGAGNFGSCSWTWYSGGFNGGGQGYRGGGGGGASDIRSGGTALTNRIAVAGGGGGAGYNCGNDHGGHGGDLIAQGGWRCGSYQQSHAGGGATQTAGGIGSTSYTGGSGSLGQGQSAWGGSCNSGHGGGGGGYYGGGGAGCGAGGGGGSSFTALNATNVTHTQGFQNSSGYVNISWVNPICESARIPAVVTVNLTPPTATGVNALCGDDVTFTASGANLYSWYSDSSLTNLVSTTANYFVSGMSATDTFYVVSHSPKTQTISSTFNFTGDVQQYVVPAGVTSLTVDVRGSKGGDASNANSGPGGRGGRVQTTLSVTPGQVLNLYVGGIGVQGNTSSWQWNQGGYNGGGQGRMQAGGGGASDIRIGGTSFNNRVVVAGGGGGGGLACNSTNSEAGGEGGGLTGGEGLRCGSLSSSNCESGSGGTQFNGGNAPCYGGTTGSFGTGGNASSSNCSSGHGGGGGGWYGGGGGGCGGAGGGGSSYTDPVMTSNTTHTQGFQNASGQIIISYEEAISFCQSQPQDVIATITGTTFTTLLSDTIVCGNPAQLTAVASVGTPSWYTVPSGGTPLFQGVGLSLPNQFQSTTYYVESIVLGTKTFNFTGATETWVVPAGVTSIEVSMSGAQGGSNSHSTGGQGGTVTATLAVTPGETLHFNVGGTTTTGNEGFNGGGNGGTNTSSWAARGGGGASDIRSGGTAPSNRILVAGGGGGAGADCQGTNNERGGLGGGLTGTGGFGCNSTNNGGIGAGGTQLAGGVGPNWCNPGGPFAGSLGQGGSGTSCQNGYGGGGGGGYFGGGGGGYGGGGGGSSFAEPSRTSNVQHVQGNRNGNGTITISYVNTVCSTPRLPVEVVIDSLPAPTVSPDAIGCAPVTNTFTATAGPGTVTWTNTPFGSGTILGTGSQFTATASDTTNYYVGVVDANGCPSKRAKAAILATPLPDAQIDPAFVSFCDNLGVVTLQANTPGGIWSGTAITDANLGTFNPAVAGVGQATVDYSVVANGCSNSATSTIDILPAPDASILTSIQPFCENGTALLLQTQDSGGVWTGEGISMTGDFDPVLAGIGTHVVHYAILSSNGCADQDSVVMVVNALPDPTVSGAPSQLCANAAPVSLSPATSGGVWTGSGVNVSTGVFNPASAGTGTANLSYVVTQNGCTDSAHVAINVLSVPAVSIQTPPATYCVNSSVVQLSGQVSGGTWSGPGIVNTSTGIYDPALSGVGTAQVFYAVQQGPCVAMDSVVLTVEALPAATLSPGGTTALCEGNAQTFTASGGQSYQWFVNGSVIPGATSATYAASQSGTYSVQSVSANNCVSNAVQAALQINPKPVIQQIMVSPVCEGASSNFQAQVQLASGTGASLSNFNWDFNGAGTSTQAQPQFVFPTAGSQTVTLIVGSNQGCLDTLQATAVVNPVPVAGTVTASAVCLGNPTVFNGSAVVPAVNGATIQTQTWALGNGQTASGATTSQTYNQTGTYNYTYTAVTNHGCSVQVNGSTEVYANPVAMFTVNADCQGASALFADLSSANVNSWNWNFGDGNSDTVQNPTHVYASSGSFMPSLTVSTVNGCTHSFSQGISIAPSPDSDFTQFAQGNLVYQFSPAQLVAGATYTWSFGDGSASADFSPLKTYAFTGDYTVCLSVKQGNCLTQTCKTVSITDEMGQNNLLTDAMEVYPNPFVNEFRVNLPLAAAAPVTLTLYDMAGKELMNRDAGLLDAGMQEIRVNLSDAPLATGVYVLAVRIDQTVQYIKLVSGQ
jgi:PKD repeat protein